jgi:tRNA A-37 threonylcarbamoyl transferase component Bud32
MKIIKELKGYSGSKILLMEDSKIFVRKIGNVSRNIERLSTFKNLGLPCPDIINYDEKYDCYDMEYIIGLDIKNYLTNHPTKYLKDFLVEVIQLLSNNGKEVDYTEIYLKKLKQINFTCLDFTLDNLMDVLPRRLPKTNYHGDLTLENVLYDTKKEKFVLIDPLTTEYDSYVFDLAKLRQDISCFWFIRNESFLINNKLQQLYDELKRFDHFEDNSLLILMLLRVIAYLPPGQDFEYLINEANKLWKLSYLAQD